MKALPPRKIEFWGQEVNVNPMLIEEQIGDGARLMWFQYYDDRPWYYIVKADSRPQKGTDDFMSMIRDIRMLIEEESISDMTDEQVAEYDVLGWPEETRDFPIPPIILCGYCWGDYKPDDADKRIMQ